MLSELKPGLRGVWVVEEASRTNTLCVYSAVPRPRCDAIRTVPSRHAQQGGRERWRTAREGGDALERWE